MLYIISCYRTWTKTQLVFPTRCSSSTQTSSPSSVKQPPDARTAASPTGQTTCPPYSCSCQSSPYTNSNTESGSPNTATQQKGAILRTWLDSSVNPAFEDRLLPVNAEIARQSAAFARTQPRTLQRRTHRRHRPSSRHDRGHPQHQRLRPLHQSHCHKIPGPEIPGAGPSLRLVRESVQAPSAL